MEVLAAFGDLRKAKPSHFCGMNVKCEHVFQSRSLFWRMFQRGVFQKMTCLAYERKRTSLLDFMQQAFSCTIECEYTSIERSILIKFMNILSTKVQHDVEYEPLDSTLWMTTTAAFIEKFFHGEAMRSGMQQSVFKTFIYTVDFL